MAQEFDSLPPLFQLIHPVKVIVALPGRLVLPPFFGIAAVETDIADLVRGQGHFRRHQPGQSRLIDTAQRDFAGFQPFQDRLVQPAPVPELDHRRKGAQPLQQMFEKLELGIPVMEAERKLQQYRRQLTALRQRFHRFPESPQAGRQLALALMSDTAVCLDHHLEFVRGPGNQITDQGSSGERIVARIELQSLEMLGIISKVIIFRQTRRVKGPPPVRVRIAARADIVHSLDFL